VVGAKTERETRETMDLKKGDKIIVNGNGSLYSEGVPKNMDGRKAVVVSVGPKLARVVIDGEFLPRKIRIATDIRRRAR
jgi:hypothetical protein